MLLLLSYYTLAQCWDTGGIRWSPDPISAGYEASQSIGVGSLEVDCLGGVVTSAGGSPKWMAALVGVGKENVSYSITYLVNSSNPYHARVFNADPSTSWSLVFHNYNNVRQMIVNITYTIKVSKTPFPLPPPSPPLEYDDPTARVAVIYSAAAYAIPENIQQWALNASCMSVTRGFALQKIYDGQNESIFTPFGYVGLDYEREWIVVAFKGTNGTKDTVADLMQIFSGATLYQSNCVINQHISGNTHSGFCSYYQTLQNLGILNDVLQLMQQFQGFAVMTTGHSLGGAIATLFHVDLTTTLQATNPSWVYRVIAYSFGQPRVADAGLAFNLPQMFRVIHYDDEIPHLCPCCADGIYCQNAETCPYHVSREIWYQQEMIPNSNFTMCNTADGEDPLCSNSLSMPVSLNNHLYYFGIVVGSYCYNPTAYEAYLRKERETAAWLQSLSSEERKKRIASFTNELMGRTGKKVL
eukprot:TRINITY_DN3564_c0_g3_i1.p1 TRINITY_DN3564_c0_g3~~TRINITY_DN3564_c0_g3_i1.p1  ORF type:complete len:469 (+),score=97.56 TRINITY_DN3564_c0_g3_i1:43-1449(+)